MNKVKAYFTRLPFSLKSAVIVTTVITVLVMLQSYIWVGKIKNKPDFWESDHAIFPIINHVIWLGFAPLIYSMIFNIRAKEIQATRPFNRIGFLIALSIIFTIAHEVVGVLIYNSYVALTHMNDGNFVFNINSGVFGLSKSFFEFWIIYFVLLSFHNQKNIQQIKVKNSLLEADLLKAQMSALKNQLHPHFLFNSFNTISALMEENVELAQRMISKLGALLRKILKEADTQFITVKEEIDLAKLYLEVEQIRFDGRLITHFSVDPNAVKIQIPSLILQPAIENAIKHGFYKKTDKCNIYLSVREETDVLVLEVIDNGAGVKNETDFSFGMGLKNIQERLKRCYGNQFTFYAKPMEEGGFMILIKIQKEALTNEHFSSAN
ncbi:sensor histidine kinase [Ekhidna sp.]|uniref:sensor histidine kinase n=1 Tax=Ekhidna sp. TaxID=2608089 RepID=UPI003BA99864